jgi:predicted DNA-binding transcriptional regulator AlpA
MTETKISDLIGLTELAEVLGVSKNEANAIRQRHGFPQPVRKFRMGPAWDKLQVLAWNDQRAEPGADHILSIHCAWCGSVAIDDTFPAGMTTLAADSTIREVICGNHDCRKTSWVYFLIGSAGDGHNITLSVKVSKEQPK